MWSGGVLEFGSSVAGGAWIVTSAEWECLLIGSRAAKSRGKPVCAATERGKLTSALLAEHGSACTTGAYHHRKSNNFRREIYPNPLPESFCLSVHNFIVIIG